MYLSYDVRFSLLITKITSALGIIVVLASLVTLMMNFLQQRRLRYVSLSVFVHKQTRYKSWHHLIKDLVKNIAYHLCQSTFKRHHQYGNQCVWFVWSTIRCVSSALMLIRMLQPQICSRLNDHTQFCCCLYISGGLLKCRYFNLSEFSLW